MPFKIRVSPKHERESQIATGCKSSSDFVTFHEYQNSAQKLPVVRLPIELLIYRMANGRTRTDQIKHIRKHDLSMDFFAAGQENQDAQQVQHDLLDRFSKESTTSITSIASVLAEGRQTEPILISSSAVVVNGNRRVAAMRELYATGEAPYRGYSHVNCSVLPASTTDREIKEIEIRLQMQPETKLPYTWVNEALTIKDLMASGFSRDQIAQDMRKDGSEVDAALRALSHAEIYLTEWRRQPEEYELVESAAQIFGDMAKLLKNKSGEELELSRRVAYVIQDNSKQLRNRAYAFNFSFRKKAPEVAEALAVRLGVDLTSPAPSPSAPGGLEIDLDADDEIDGSSYRPLIDVLDDQSRRDEVAAELIAVCDSIRAADQDEKRGQAALKAVKDANTRLLEVDISTADTGTYIAMNAQLDSVIARAQKLKEQLASAKVGSRLRRQAEAVDDVCRSEHSDYLQPDYSAGHPKAARFE